MLNGSLVSREQTHPKLSHCVPSGAALKLGSKIAKTSERLCCYLWPGILVSFSELLHVLLADKSDLSRRSRRGPVTSWF